MKAVFFDRDNTLIIDSGYMYQPEQLKFFDDTFSVLKRLQDLGFILFIVTNQSGIGRGYYTEDQMHVFNANMLKVLKENDIEIKDIVHCPHAPDDNCSCRKPSPELIDNLCQKYQIDKSKSYMVGDKDSDLESGENAKMKGLKLAPGHLSDFLDLLS